MYELLNTENRRAVRQLLWAVVKHSVVWPVAIPGGFTVLFAVVAGLGGLNPIDFAGGFAVEAASNLAGLVFNLWTICFLCAAFCFGISRFLPHLLQHRTLNGRMLARYTQAIALWAHGLNGIASLFSGPFHRLPLLDCASRTALNTSSTLAGAAPRLE